MLKARAILSSGNSEMRVSQEKEFTVESYCLMKDSRLPPFLSRLSSFGD
jgi:hypothetical protein